MDKRSDFAVAGDVVGDGSSARTVVKVQTSIGQQYTYYLPSKSC
jgi:hypothetical protein